MKKERGETPIRVGKGFKARLTQFFGRDEVDRKIESGLKEASNIADLFRRLTKERGAGKSHASGKPEGKLKNS